MDSVTTFRRWILTDSGIVSSFALLALVVHLPFIGEYGYFRDELYYIACSKHLAWGYVDQPPLSLFLLAVTRALFGESLLAIRILPAITGALVVFVTGRMARELGGGRFAQILAALAALTAPVILGNAGRYFSMNAFDLLFWALGSWVVVRIIRDNAEKLWLVFGGVAGMGLMNKYSIGFFILGLGIGMLLTPARRHFLSRWFWLGALVGLLIVGPHLVWEYQNGFPSREFIHNASTLKNTSTSPLEFFLGQIGNTGPGNAVVWIGGLVFAFVAGEQKRWRLFGVIYLAIFTVMAFQNSKAYYLSPIYPLMFALGGCGIESLARRATLRWVRPVTVGLMLLGAIVLAPYAIPMLPVETFIRYQELLGLTPPREEIGQTAVLPQYYADMFGWEEMVDTVAGVYRKLPPEDQGKCLIYVRNYGEAAAIDFFGKRYGLPAAACTHNSYWYWKPSAWTGEVSIIFGPRMDTTACFQDLRQFFEQVELVTSTSGRYGMPFEIGRPIFICRKAKITLDELWSRDRSFM
jgi:hypothetical protein